MFDLTGTLAVVTGASRGIGAAYASALADAGADIIAVSRSIPDDGGEVGEAVRSADRGFTAIRADLSDRDGVTALSAQLRALPRPVDILVSNAGLTQRSTVIDQTDRMWDEVIEVNLSSQFVLARDLGTDMVARGRGKIIFTASLLSFQGGIKVVSYAASKSGLAGLIHGLATEWAPFGVNVNGIAPGYIATELNLALQKDQDRYREILARIPAGRWGSPSDLAGAVVFLASSASDYVNGILLPVDGGWLAR